MKYLNSAYYIVLFFVPKMAKCKNFLSFFFKVQKKKSENEGLWSKCKHFFLFFYGSETFVLGAIIGHFFCQKKPKRRDFGQKIDENQLLHSPKFSKVKYLNSDYYIVLFFGPKIPKCKNFSQFFPKTKIL